jgi:hypothetical protein
MFEKVSCHFLENQLFYFNSIVSSGAKMNFFQPWRRGIVVIASAYKTEDPGFDSRHGVRFLGIYTLQCCCHNLICMVIVFN